MTRTNRVRTDPQRHRRRLAGVVAGLLAGGLSVTGVPLAAASMGSGYETDVATYTNAERRERGIAKTSWSRCLDGYAEAQAKKMANRQSLQHQNLSPILRDCHLNLVGENIAMGYRSGRAATAAWMKSPGHKENILRKGFKMHGVGAYRDSGGTWWVSHVFGRRA